MLRPFQEKYYHRRGRRVTPTAPDCIVMEHSKAPLPLDVQVSAHPRTAYCPEETSDRA